MSLDPQVAYLMKLAAANQEVAQEKRQNSEVALSDFEGVVMGVWATLNDDGSGTVEYKGKEYKTVAMGTKSIPAGSKVSLEFRKGHYISYW